MIENNNGHFKKKIRISNEDLQKLLPDDSKWLVPIVETNFVRIPISNFSNIGISSVSIPFKNFDSNAISYLSIRINNIEDVSFIPDDLVYEIYKKKNGDIFLELSSLYYNL